MATIGRGTSKSGTDTRSAESNAPRVETLADDPVIGTGDPKRADPVTRTGDPKQADPVIRTGAPKQADPVTRTGDPKQADPVVESRDRKQADPVVEPDDPKKALAASEIDLIKLQAVRRARVIKAVALTAIALVLIVFVLQNAGPVDVRLVAWTVPIRLIWVIVASVLLGAVAGYLVGRPDKQLRLHGPNRRQKDPL